MSIRTKKMMEFSRSESNSSLESEIPSKGYYDDDETHEYSAYKDELCSRSENFQPIRPLRSFQSLGSSFPVKNSSSMKDNDATTRKAGGRDVGAPNAAVIVSMIDKKMKEHTNNLFHAAHSISAQITQLESRRRRLEDLIDDVKDSIEFYHGRTERRLGELEDIMTEVQGGIKDLRDKQEISEAQLQLAILQLSSVNSQSKRQSNNNGQTKPVPQLVSDVHQQDQQQYPSTAAGQQRNCDLPSFAPASQHPQTLVDQAVQLPQRLEHQPQHIQRPQTWYRPPVSVPDSAYQKNHMFLTQSSVTPHRPYVKPSVSPSSQLWYAPHMVSPPQQFYSQNMINQYSGSSSSKFHQEHSEPPGNFNSTDPSEGSPFQYWSSTMKTAQPLSLSSVRGGDYSYTSSPTTKDLPRAIPMAKNVNDASKSDGTDVSATTEDIVEKVVAMGFRRDTVKATIRKLTDAGKSVDLNVVLDKLFNNA
ncbi:hypothetical protein L6164_014754 [Bauhinia variegata]|uniref:Uncharacterized protein n=1 Tax=Bauhinia variegata TaxID=167791 RepID=A0ACB9NKB3_BAUVA|nr:hypothetical protein L6164_014754 [Bauhinia variegata]